MKLTATPAFAFFLLVTSFISSAQTLPVGTPVLEETLRKMQMSGEKDISPSFAIRPVYTNTKGFYDSLYNPTGVSPSLNKPIFFAKSKGSLRLLSITLKQQYNSHHPYGWNDGSMIQARGYQNQLSAGVHTKWGPLSVQLQPELIYAQNQTFTTFPSAQSDSIWKSYFYVVNRIDNPEKYGDKEYAKLFWGQSSFRFNFKKLSLGVSTENLWWGPGIRNSLVMSNNAPGFPHISFNTTAPVASPVGSFEWQLIGGQLRGSGIRPSDTTKTFNGEGVYIPKQEDATRYLNGLIITWQPKWTKGLYLGFTNVFYLYQSDLQPGIASYLPVLGLSKAKGLRSEELKRDQMLSLFFRLVLQKEKAEVYGEFGRNDHALDLLDMFLEPEHARAYIIGLKKIFIQANKQEVEWFMEITHLQNPPTMRLRALEGWYTHYQVRHGYTNFGQVIGAGIGPGGSSQTMGLNWIKEIKKFGVMLERVVRNNDFYYDAFEPLKETRRHWVDLSVSLNKNWYCKKILYDASIGFVRSFNYQWQPQNHKNNLHASLAVSYLF
jgi:hypothetical protein